MTIARYAGRIALVTALLAMEAPVLAQNYAVLSANLFGDSVPGGGAGPDAAADFDGEIDLDQDQLCYFLELEGLDDANAVHIHQAKEGESGPVVVTLPLPGADGDEVCVKADKALLRAMADQPSDYYVDVHSRSNPDGAVRGQFGG
jgi:hypothetical protein